MLYAAAAVELEDRVETRGHLLAALQRNPAAVRILPLSLDHPHGAAVSPDGRLLASGDVAGRRALHRPPHLDAERRAGATRTPSTGQAWPSRPTGGRSPCGTREGRRGVCT